MFHVEHVGFQRFNSQWNNKHLYLVCSLAVKIDLIKYQQLDKTENKIGRI